MLFLISISNIEKGTGKNLNYLLSDSELISDRLLESSSGQYGSKIICLSHTVFFQDCHNKVSQTGWLKITEIDSITVTEAKSQEGDKAMVSLRL